MILQQDTAMAETTMMSFRLSATSKSKLDKLAIATRRSRSFLAQEAVNRFIESESKIIEGILRAKQQVQSGQVVPHNEVMKELDKMIDDIEARKKASL